MIDKITIISITTSGPRDDNYDKPPRSTQPGHPSVGRRNEYQPKGGDALWLGVKADMARVWWQVKLCEPLYNMCHI